MSAAILERLRETLDTALPRAEGAALLFAALARWGPRIPATDVEVASFVRGALRNELAGKLGLEERAALDRALEDVLATAGAPTADREIPIEIQAPVTWRDERSTKALRSIAGPVPVLVVAASTAFALRLRLSLGDATIDVEARADLPGIERALAYAPALAVVDARDPSGLPVDRLADALVHATKTTTIVWGSDTPYGQRVIAAGDARGVQLAGIGSSEGIAPVFDLVTSRRA